MFNWLREFYDVMAARRQTLREERREQAVCPSCETLQRQLEIKNHECEQLLVRLLEKPEAPKAQEAPAITSKPRMVSWQVRREMLEAEDRRKAQLLRNAPKPQPQPQTEEDKQEVAELERELNVAEQTREATNV